MDRAGTRRDRPQERAAPAAPLTPANLAAATTGGLHLLTATLPDMQPSLQHRAATTADMFDLAAPPVEAPLIASLVPFTADAALNRQLSGQGILLPRIELRSVGDVVIGRSVALHAPFRIDFARLSSEHCRLSVEAVAPTARVTITDLSTNGLWVNGERLVKNTPRLLKARDVVSLLKPSSSSDSETTVHFPFVFEPADDRAAAAAAAEAAATAAAIAANAGAFLDEITCSVCLGTYVKPTCVLPCLHTFCGPCVRKYIAEARRGGATAAGIKCPECRTPLTSYTVNHKVQSLILQVAHSNRACERPADELRQLEEEALEAEASALKAGITSLELGGGKGAAAARAARRRREVDDDNSNDDDDDYEEEEDDGSDDDDGGGGAAFGARARNNFNVGGGFGGAGWNNVQAQFLPMGFAFQAPVTACDTCRVPDARDGFTCPAGGNHLSCKYCRRNFPDRPACGIPQRCRYCATAFCDVYCGPCRNGAGVGVLRELESHTFDQLPIGTLFRGNNVEVQILQNYLHDNRIDVKTLWETCADKFKKKEWTLDLTTGMGVLEAATPVCKPCAQRVFATLLARYRMAVPRDAWPPAVAGRPDCWYGLDCNTQHKNPLHAQRYNHVCVPRKGKE